MRITRLELVGYTRVSLNNIEHLIYTPESIYQLILGTNGSGKSSILAELSPLPAHHSFYAKPHGLKDIRISFQGREYQLVSSFAHGKTGKHSFIVDGEDYNKGGTSEVQLALVEQHFSYTKELHELLTGQVSFTDMDNAQRRKWITALSTQDYGFALGLYKTLAGAARDAQGTVKHLKRRLGEGHEQLKALGSIDGLVDRAGMLRDELDTLLTERNPNARPADEMRRELSVMTDKVVGLAERVVNTVTQLRAQRHAGITNFQMLESNTQHLEQESVAQRALTSRLTAEYSELETAVHGYRTSDGITPETIDTHLMEIRDQIDHARGELDPDLQDFGDADPVCVDLGNMLDQLVALFYRLPDNQDRRFSQQTVEDQRRRMAVVLEQCGRLDGLLLRINRRIAMIEQAADTTCPSCDYVWKEGVSQGELEELQGQRGVYAQQLETLTSERRVLQGALDEAQEVTALYNEFRTLRSHYPRLVKLWEHIALNRWHLEAPASHVQGIQQWARAAQAVRKVQGLERREAQLRDLAEQWSTEGGISHLGQRMTQIMEAIERETIKQNKLRNEVADAQAYLSRVRALDNLADQMGMLVDQIQRQYAGVYDSLRNQEIRAVTHVHHNELGSIQRQLTEHQTLIGVVKDLEADFGHTSIARDALGLLATALSPTEGLIAEQLSGFINCLTSQLNSIIDSVWTHDMTVLPCGLDTGELDYRFPLKVHGRDTPVLDVKRGSKAQQEMINLAFRLTVMLYSGLERYPLFLDEPGEGFDEQHRTNLMSFIKHLMENNQHCQLFMISHYASNHGAFTMADVTVLDESNIAVAGEYNKHITLA